MKNTDVIFLIGENSGFMNQCKWYMKFDLMSDADIGITDSNTYRVLPVVDSITWLRSVSHIFKKRVRKGYRQGKSNI